MAFPETYWSDRFGTPPDRFVNNSNCQTVKKLKCE